jgi:DNA-binding MarR family transcriptional regulator
MGANTSAVRVPAGEVQAVLDGIRRIVHGLRESSRRAEREVGLSGAQLFVLHTLADTPSISVNELAARTHTHQSSVSTVVSRLVERGFVKRIRSGDDRRRAVLTLSARGAKLAGKAPDTPQERLVAAVASLPATRRRMLAGALSELATAMHGDRKPAVMFFEDGRRAEDADE